ncbi:hypothetical protein G8770_20985 [Aestuariicella hydrocarbonica]|uniref:Uncharacterized protein n=1 Tax=Pseudomaricurvus hydrocarbonicus TaxID=1470433 RepID=A0A9E5MPH1_9GAMM|nr:hypothetical protein [Aestuariicella hydrocarbonica]NHO68030.1 hypothetical protein [Aestuariicella hydrocarbonica]
MKLQYDSQPGTETLILENERLWRVEMFLKRNEDDTYSLVALSGINSRPAELTKLQGPYQILEQGVAARSAIARQLQNKGFSVQIDQHSIWQLQAQKAIQSVRQQRADSQGNYAFHPDDVL